MRHAKSSWDQPVGDHDRTLNIGYSSARTMGVWLKTLRTSSQEALISTARPYKGYLLGLRIPTENVELSSLYHPSAQDLLSALQSQPRR